jgi:aspartyl/asparaginyl beta-hydroxylase (cupin superfamily)
VTGPGRQPGPSGIRALGRLLLGHVARFRDPRLQDLATATLREPGRAGWVVPVVNATIRARAAATRAAYLEPRRLASRAAFALRPGRRPAAPPRQLSLLCPTRGRPRWLATLLRSIERTAHLGSRVEVLCYVDADDPELPGYQALLGQGAFGRLGRCVLHIGEPLGVPTAWNVLAGLATGDYLLMANDDQLYVSYGWDLAVDAAAAALARDHPDEIGCLYFDAGQYGSAIPDFPMISRAWHQALGYYAPTIFQQWSAEKWIFDIAGQAGRLYPVPGVFVEHRHYQEFKAPFDVTYQRHRLTREKSLADQALFLRTKRERAQAAARLRDAMAQSRVAAPPAASDPRQECATMKSELADSGTGAYITQMVRRYYGNLIDAWNYAGRTEEARECAALAVRQGVWEDPLQRARDYLPGLSNQPVHDASQFWFVGHLEERYPQIRAEIEEVVASGDDPVAPTVDGATLIRQGTWEQADLFRAGHWQPDVSARFPVITALAREIPELSTFNPGLITVSRVRPGTHIMPHCGPTNAVLRIHLPIKVPPGAWIRVGDERPAWTEGKCLVFDDSFEHEVRNEGTSERIVLIIDFLHPQLGDDQRERLLQRRLTFEEQVIAFMKEHGLERIASRDGELILYPDGETRELAALYMSATGIVGAELDGDEVVWHRAREGD